MIGFDWKVPVVAEKFRNMLTFREKMKVPVPPLVKQATGFVTYNARWVVGHHSGLMAVQFLLTF